MNKSKKCVQWFLKYCPEIKSIDINYHNRVTVVKLMDGRTAGVKLRDETFDFEKGVLWAYMKAHKKKGDFIVSGLPDKVMYNAFKIHYRGVLFKNEKEFMEAWKKLFYISKY